MSARDMLGEVTALRITGPQGGFRRAGFGFGPEAVIVTASEIRVGQIIDLVAEPRLAVEIGVPPDMFVAFPYELVATLSAIHDVEVFTLDDVARRLDAGELAVDQDVLDAMLATREKPVRRFVEPTEPRLGEQVTVLSEALDKVRAELIEERGDHATTRAFCQQACEERDKALEEIAALKAAKAGAGATNAKAAKSAATPKPTVPQSAEG